MRSTDRSAFKIAATCGQVEYILLLVGCKLKIRERDGRRESVVEGRLKEWLKGY